MLDNIQVTELMAYGFLVGMGYAWLSIIFTPGRKDLKGGEID
jgi:hypothetical protein